MRLHNHIHCTLYLNNVGVSFLRCDVQRCEAHVVRHVDQRVVTHLFEVLQQRLHHLRVVVLGRQAHARVLALVRVHDVGAVLQQQLDAFHVVRAAAEQQRREELKVT